MLSLSARYSSTNNCPSHCTDLSLVCVVVQHWQGGGWKADLPSLLPGESSSPLCSRLYHSLPDHCCGSQPHAAQKARWEAFHCCTLIFSIQFLFFCFFCCCRSVHSVLVLLCCVNLVKSLSVLCSVLSHQLSVRGNLLRGMEVEKKKRREEEKINKLIN